MLWLHGGGFVGGDLRDIEQVTSGIALWGDVVVVSLNYRLAPEHPYPAGLLDALDTMAWLRAQPGSVHGDGRVAVGGQSAGAALAAGASLFGRDSGRTPPDLQVLCYPSLDVGQETESYRLFDGAFLSIAPGGWADTVYFPDGELPETAVPLRAADVGGLPAALVLAAGRDPLRDDARLYAERLAASGVPTRPVEYADTMHAFLKLHHGAIGRSARHRPDRRPPLPGVALTRPLRAPRQALFGLVRKVAGRVAHTGDSPDPREGERKS